MQLGQLCYRRDVRTLGAAEGIDGEVEGKGGRVKKNAGS